ncbi:MAG TPA: Hsp20/alpha crystallin family protein [Gammaproteobacteria bacterium]|nr:Hsp20/alpha crystallin family protein [Gammaproteobacteria bacterium]
MNLIRWNPLGDLDDFFGRLPRGLLAREVGFPAEGVEWRPAANITENDKEYTIRADLPEVKKDDIELTVTNGVLTLRGERRYEKSTDNEKEHRRETFHGTFQRSFSVPEDVDVDGIKADTKDGVLVVHLLKKAVTKPEAVKIEVGQAS